MSRKMLTKFEALGKLKQYCAYQERCHKEVRYKLVSLGMRGSDVEEIMDELICEGYLDETRYARSYARGKLRIKKWGWLKIKRSLQVKGISDYNLRQAHLELDAEEYKDILNAVLERKWTSLLRRGIKHPQAQTYNYAMSRGFEPHLIIPLLQQLGKF